MHLGRLAAVAALGLTLAACGTASPAGHADHVDHDMSSMPGMDMGQPGTGLEAAVDGYTLRPGLSVLPLDRAFNLTFTITSPTGKPLTSYQDDQTRTLHFYLVNAGLTDFQHIHATMSADGTWTAAVAPLQSRGGESYRMYAAFIPGDGPAEGKDLVLSAVARTPGDLASIRPLATQTTASVDGYTATITGSARTGMGMLDVAITKGSAPATLERYLDTYAHVTAVRSGDMAFAHLHPTGQKNGVLAFHTEFPEAGTWRLFVQFQTNGVLHTVPLTITVS